MIDMKKLLLVLLLTSKALLAQLVNTNPDTVCFETNVYSNYEVTLDPNLLYTWYVDASATIVSGQSTNHITVNWSNTPPGLIVNGVTVQAQTAAGCFSPLKHLDIFIYDVNVSFTQVNDICENDGCVSLLGIPQNGLWSGTGTFENTFCPNISGTGTFNVVYTYTNAGCSFLNTMNINVIPMPILQPIGHD
jgi:hypothetical protein